MTLTPIAKAYAELINSVPRNRFPIEDSPEILRSINEKIASLRSAINSLTSRSLVDCLSCRPKQNLDDEIANAKKEFDSDKMFERPREYLTSIASLSKRNILGNLEQAVAFITSPLQIEPSSYTKYLGLTELTAKKRLPKKTVRVFHAYARGISMCRNQELGKGSYGVVFKIQINYSNGFSNRFACKEQRTDKDAASKEALTDASIQEVCAYSLLDHPHILELSAFTESPCRLYLEYASNSTLWKLIESQPKLQNNFCVIDSSLRHKLFRQLADGLNYLHGKGFTHCDFKPDNILISKDNNAKIGDLGFVFNTRTNQRTNLTPEYAAPETIKKGLLSEKLDVWAYGIILYETFKNHSPYRAYDVKKSDYRERLFADLYKKPANLPVIFKEAQKAQWDQYDPGDVFRTLIERCLHGNPEERISMEAALEYLSPKEASLEDLTGQIQVASIC